MVHQLKSKDRLGNVEKTLTNLKEKTSLTELRGTFD